MERRRRKKASEKEMETKLHSPAWESPIISRIRRDTKKKTLDTSFNTTRRARTNGRTGKSSMQTKGITSKPSEDACKKESRLALACSTRQTTEDKSECDSLFQAYRECRRVENERVIAERIAKRKSAF